MTETGYTNETIRKHLRLDVELIQDEALRNTCKALWLDERFRDMDLTPAALSWHHNYEGGLIAHTGEVTRIAVNAAEKSIIKVNLDVLVAAAVWHDVAKIQEYELCFASNREDLPAKHLEISVDDLGSIRYWKTGEFYKRIYHISGSAMEFHHYAMKHGVDELLARKVEHCILAHHGPVKDWGSPVEPQSLEALILHHADMVSSKFGPAMRKP